MQFCFGPFCFDLETLILTKYGVTLRLEEKPARLLACLIERQGEVVSREELKRRLWNESLYLDFDRGLNNAANKLRSVLTDDPVRPTYIETLTRRGYRFIGQAQPISSSEPTENSAAQEPLAPSNLDRRVELYSLEQGQQPFTPPEQNEVTLSAPATQIPRLSASEASSAEVSPGFFSRSFMQLALFSSIALFLLAGSMLVVRGIRAKTADERDCRLGIFEGSGTLPRNPEAERFYLQGVTQLERSNAVDARALFDQSIAIEPEHAFSHFALSRAYSMMGYSENARAEAQNAFNLSSRLPATTRLLFEAQLRETSFDWDHAIEIYRSLFSLSPSNRGFGMLLLHAETEAGDPALAFETLRQLRQSPLRSCAEAEIDLAEAEAARAISDFRRQQAMSERAAETARASGQDLMLARAEVMQGEAQRSLGNFRDALSSWDDARNRFSAIGDRSPIARILIDEGRLHWQQGDLPAAEQSYNEAIALSQQIGDQLNLGRALAGLGQMTMYRVGWDQGRKICEQALTVFRQIGNRQGEAYTLSLIADTMAWQHSKSKPLYEQSLVLSRQVNDRSRVAGRLMDLGIIAATEGDLLTAERNVQQSLEIYHNIGERNREALQMCVLAMVFKWEGRLTDAEKLARQAVEILQSVGETNVRGQARQHLALIQMEAGKLSEAEQTIRLAIEDARAAGDMGYLGLALQDLSDILITEGKVAESESALDESDKVGNWTPQIGEGVTLRMLTRANIDAAKGQFQFALQEARRACAQAVKMDQGTVAMKARLVLGEIELESGNRSAGQRDLQQLARDAFAKGFGLIHDQADQALEQRSLSARMQLTRE